MTMLGGLAIPGAAQAGTLSYDAGTQVLTFHGSDASNLVFADHPEGDPAHLRFVDVGGEETTAAGAPACEYDDIDFYLICPTPQKLVLHLGGGDDSFSDESVGGGVPTAVPVDVYAGAGADEIDGGNGPDLVFGGADDDRLLGSDGIDTLLGEDGLDTLEGGGGNDDLAGGPGPDRLTGGPGNDTVRGGEGDDELDYSPQYALDGSDTFQGGGGRDAVGYFGRTVAVAIYLDGQANDGQAGESDNIAGDIEEVDGGDLPDIIVGSAGPDGLAGRGGDDRISGGGGNDVILGDSGNDTILGEDGDDTLDGGCHDDDITGGPGVDSFTSDGTCESPALRGANDVLRARDGVRDALILCTMTNTAEDTAIVDPVDPALGAGNPGACRTIDAGTIGAGTPGGTTPGGTTPGGTTPGGTTPGGGGPAATLAGRLLAQLGPSLRLLSGTGGTGQAARQLVDPRRRTLTLGSLVAGAPVRLTTKATTRIRGRTVSLGSVTVTIDPATPRTLTLRLSRKARNALRRLRRASVKVAFVVQDPADRKVTHRSTKTFRVPVRR